MHTILNRITRPALLLLCSGFAPMPCMSTAGGTPLPTPQTLQPAVNFWLKVYTQIDDQSGYLHDDTDLNIIYDTIQLPEDTDRPQQKNYITAVLEQWRAALQTPAESTDAATAERRSAIHRIWGPNADAATLRRAAQRLRFQRGQANRFRDGFIRSGAYKPHIHSVLNTLALPLTLANLPHVESSFTPFAHSRVGAAGLWQFTRATGRRFMRIDHVVDERLDPDKATVAAARLLKHNYQALQHWPLAITAYNYGLAGMRRAVKATGSTDIGVIARHYQGGRFGFASRNFYAAFLAASQVDAHAEDYFGPLKRAERPRRPRVTLTAYLPATAVAKGLDISLSALRKLNPSLLISVWRGEKYLPKGYQLVLPDNSAKAKLPQLIAHAGRKRQRRDRFYQVRRGDTLLAIAKHVGVPASALQRANALRNKHLIHIGQRLRIPTIHRR